MNFAILMIWLRYWLLSLGNFIFSSPLLFPFHRWWAWQAMLIAYYSKNDTWKLINRKEWIGSYPWSVQELLIHKCSEEVSMEIDKEILAELQQHMYKQPVADYKPRHA